MNKIDLVYLWVDSNDPQWIQEKQKWLEFTCTKTNLSHSATSNARWRDNDELKYSLRSVAECVPWINHIFIITGFNQIPKWLNVNHPKITIVPHKDIMPLHALPTFNSTNIEMCIGNIKALGEYFILANDDTFFNRELNPDFFFDRRGRAKFRYNKRRGNYKNIERYIVRKNDYQQCIFVSQRKIYDVFGKKLYKYMPSHGIDPYRKSTWNRCRKHPLITGCIDAQLSNRFRQNNEIQRTIFSLFDKIFGKSVFIRARNKKRTKNRLINFLYNTIYWHSIKNSPVYCTDAILSNLQNQKPPIFCINDSINSTEENRLNNYSFLNSRFPKKCEFEK